MPIASKTLPVYMDCNATTPLDPRVRSAMLPFLFEECGNAGSRTHEFGARAKKAVELARKQVADVVSAEPREVLFTSGATESNNLAILGLAAHGRKTGKRHIISTEVEHKAVLEPLKHLQNDQNFDVTLLKPTSGGWIDPENLVRTLRADTLLVSVMHANNETGVVQPIREIAEVLAQHEAFFHVDAAQGFGKSIAPLRSQRIDMISVSAHKIYGPKGVGALVIRTRNFRRPPLSPLTYGGGQERGLRPGTLPVPLIVGLGIAAELALADVDGRAKRCAQIREEVLGVFRRFGAELNGDLSRTQPHVVNLSLPGLDSEAVIIALKPYIAISNGSACTSENYEPSHVLRAMNLPESMVRSALRISWCHMTEKPDWDSITAAVGRLR